MSTAQSNGQQNVVNDLTADEIDEIMGTETRREERPVTTTSSAQTVNHTIEEVGEMRSPKRTTKVQVIRVSLSRLLMPRSRVVLC